MGGTEPRPALLATIGGTPVVRLERLAGPDVAELWVKLELLGRELLDQLDARLDSGLRYLAGGLHAA